MVVTTGQGDTFVSTECLTYEEPTSMCAYDPVSDMPDFKSWANASGSSAFGPADYIHAQVLRGSLSPDMVGAIVQWLWPTFATLNGSVIVQGSEERYRNLVEQGLPPEEAEYWCNFLNIDGMLPGFPLLFTLHVAGVVKEAWQSKLNSEFPGTPCLVQLINEPGATEVSVTFSRRSPALLD